MSTYFHCIGRRDLATCPNCNGADKTVENQVIRCPAYDQAKKYTWLKDQFLKNPWQLWTFLERTEIEINSPTKIKDISVMRTISLFVIFLLFSMCCRGPTKHHTAPHRTSGAIGALRLTLTLTLIIRSGAVSLKHAETRNSFGDNIDQPS